MVYFKMEGNNIEIDREAYNPMLIIERVKTHRDVYNMSAKDLYNTMVKFCKEEIKI